MFANISSPICAVFRGRFRKREEPEVVTFSLFTDKGGHGIEGEQGCTGALPWLFVESSIAFSFSSYYLSTFIYNTGYQ
jgi:hypothetical protein